MRMISSLRPPLFLVSSFLLLLLVLFSVSLGRLAIDEAEADLRTVSWDSFFGDLTTKMSPLPGLAADLVLLIMMSKKDFLTADSLIVYPFPMYSLYELECSTRWGCRRNRTRMPGSEHKNALLNLDNEFKRRSIPVLQESIKSKLIYLYTYKQAGTNDSQRQTRQATA